MDEDEDGVGLREAGEVVEGRKLPRFELVIQIVRRAERDQHALAHPVGETRSSVGVFGSGI